MKHKTKASLHIVAALIVATSSGCGGSYRVHYEAARGASVSIEQLGVVIEHVCSQAEREQVPPERIDAWEASCVRAVASQNTLVDLWTDWVVAASTDGWDAVAVVRMGTELLQTYNGVARLVKSIDPNTSLPELDL